MSTLETIRKLMQERLHLKPEETEPEQSLEALGIDSLSVVELMFELEDAFHIKLTEERAPIRTVGDVVSLVDRVLAAKGAAPDTVAA